MKEAQFLHRISDRLWYMDPTVATDRPALGYIKGDRMSVVVDAGNSPAHYSEFLALLAAENLPAPSLCLITHSHWDHTFGIAGLNIPCAACKLTAEHLAELKADLESGKQQLVNLSDECLKAEYGSLENVKIELPTVIYEDRLELDLGGVTVTAQHVGGPHADDSVLVIVNEERFIFAGDSCAGNFSLPNIAYDIPLLDEYTETLMAIPFSGFMHAHRPIMNREETFTFLAEGRARGYYTFD